MKLKAFHHSAGSLRAGLICTLMDSLQTSIFLTVDFGRRLSAAYNFHATGETKLDHPSFVSVQKLATGRPAVWVTTFKVAVFSVSLFLSLSSLSRSFSFSLPFSFLYFVSRSFSLLHFLFLRLFFYSLASTPHWLSQPLPPPIFIILFSLSLSFVSFSIISSAFLICFNLRQQ